MVVKYDVNESIIPTPMHLWLILIAVESSWLTIRQSEINESGALPIINHDSDHPNICSPFQHLYHLNHRSKTLCSAVLCQVEDQWLTGLGPLSLAWPQVCTIHRQPSIMVDVHYTASAGQSSTGPASNSASLMLSPRRTSPFQDEHGMDSNDQTELSRYKRLYNQTREDLDKLKCQAKRRSVQTVPPAICAHWNELGKLPAGHNWDVAYVSSSPCLMIYRQSSTSTTYTASYVRA